MRLDRPYGRGDPVFMALQQALKGRDLLTDGREAGKNGRGAKPRAISEADSAYVFSDRNGEQLTVRKCAPPPTTQCRRRQPLFSCQVSSMKQPVPQMVHSRRSVAW